MSIAGNKGNHPVIQKEVGGNFSVTAKVPEKTVFIALQKTSVFQPVFHQPGSILDAVITFGMCNDGNFAALRISSRRALIQSGWDVKSNSVSR